MMTNLFSTAQSFTNEISTKQIVFYILMALVAVWVIYELFMNFFTPVRLQYQNSLYAYSLFTR